MTEKRKEGWPPKECHMPDIQDLNDKNILNVVLSVILAGKVLPNRISQALIYNYIRIVDHLVREYKYARNALIEYIETPNNTISPLFVATSHLETCLSLMRRSLRFLEGIRRTKECPTLPKNILVLRGGPLKAISDMRSAIEHLEERLLKCEEIENQTIALNVMNEKIELFEKTISYNDLASWIRELHVISSQLAEGKDEIIL